MILSQFVPMAVPSAPLALPGPRPGRARPERALSGRGLLPCVGHAGRRPTGTRGRGGSPCVQPLVGSRHSGWAAWQGVLRMNWTSQAFLSKGKTVGVGRWGHPKLHLFRFQSFSESLCKSHSLLRAFGKRKGGGEERGQRSRSALERNTPLSTKPRRIQPFEADWTWSFCCLIKSNRFGAMCLLRHGTCLFTNTHSEWRDVQKINTTSSEFFFFFKDPFTFQSFS